MAFNEEQRELILDIVSDPRYTLESNMKGLFLADALKKAVLAKGLVKKLNDAYCWNLPMDMNLNGKQINDLIYEIVLNPEYSLKKFLKAIKAGEKLKKFSGSVKIKLFGIRIIHFIDRILRFETKGM